MKRLGDICKISGYTAPIVDVITGGSPCQDLSVAGKRAGLAGERSGLFMEQIRTVKEMRERDRATGRTGWMVRPRYMVWENVPGAFSSGKPKGADFAAVIEEIIKAAEPGASVSVCVPNGGWTKSGCYYADDGSWSIAWRVHDAQFWGATQTVDGRVLNLGTPQRRKRIALVADFGGLSAPEILFERKGMSGDSEPCGTAREETAGGTGKSAYPAIANTLTRRYDGSPQPDKGNGANIVGCGNSLDSQSERVYCGDGACDTISFQERGGKPGGGKGILIQNEHVGALSTLNNQSVLAYGISSYDSNAMKSPNPHSGIYEADTARPLDLNGGSPACNQGGIAVVQPHVYDARCNGDGKTVCTITGDHQNRVTDYTGLCVGNGQLNQVSMAEQANTLDTMHDQQAVLIAAVDCRNGTENTKVNGTLQAKSTGGISSNLNNVCRCDSVVRRLTPLECERLQGYPDGWTDIGEWVDSKGKKHKEADSPRYKALGNSIALPFWAWLARRICAQYERTVTMASLFDGIGGFPLVFQRCGAVPVWASEIEEFPIAVTKRHFPEEDDMK